MATNVNLVTDGDVSASYDSSNGVKIGKVGGTDIYAPKATESQLGLVKPVAATAAMTQNVGVKTDGSLVTTPSSGSGGVTQIVAGSNVTISPASGTGAVTINATGGGSGGVTKLVAGSNITLSPAGGTGEVTISASGGGGEGGSSGYILRVGCSGFSSGIRVVFVDGTVITANSSPTLYFGVKGFYGCDTTGYGDVLDDGDMIIEQKYDSRSNKWFSAANLKGGFSSGLDTQWWGHPNDLFIMTQNMNIGSNENWD